MKNKVSSLILTLTASVALIGVPAVAQIGGALGGTLNGGAQARGNRGGVAGGLGVDHTLNGTQQRGGRGLDLGGDSSLNGNGSLEATQDMQRQSRDNGSAAVNKAKGKVGTTTDTTVDTASSSTTKAKGKIGDVKGDADQALKSTSVSSSTEASSETKASSGKDGKSASSNLDLSNALKGRREVRFRGLKSQQPSDCRIEIEFRRRQGIKRLG